MAAERLNVTQTAVSQQVKTLEKHLGTALVTKRGRGIELTSPGIRLARELGIGFEIMGRGVERLSEDVAIWRTCPTIEALNPRTWGFHEGR
jgi:LysR family glycine cleavage system transcriptional activator